MARSRTDIIIDFMKALDAHVAEVIHERTASSTESNTFGSHAAREALENALIDVLDYVPDHRHSDGYGEN